MKKKLLFVFTILVLIMVGAVGVLLFSGWSGQNQAEDRPKKTISYEPGGVFVTNLRDSRKLLKVSLILEMENKKPIKYMTSNNYKIRDIIIDILSRVTEKDIENMDVRGDLKEEIRQRLQDELALGGIIDIFFNEFVTQ